MNAPEDALAETVIAWACQPTIGETTYHDTEAAAESLARSLVGSAPGLRECVVYRVRKRRRGGCVRAVGARRGRTDSATTATLTGPQTANLGGSA